MRETPARRRAEQKKAEEMEKKWQAEALRQASERQVAEEQEKQHYISQVEQLAKEYEVEKKLKTVAKDLGGSGSVKKTVKISNSYWGGYAGKGVQKKVEITYAADAGTQKGHNAHGKFVETEVDSRWSPDVGYYRSAEGYFKPGSKERLTNELEIVVSAEYKEGENLGKVEDERAEVRGDQWKLKKKKLLGGDIYERKGIVGGSLPIEKGEDAFDEALLDKVEEIKEERGY